MLRLAAPVVVVLFAQTAPSPPPLPPPGPPPLPVTPTVKSMDAAFDRDYDACLAQDQSANVIVEFAPSGKIVSVEGEGPLAGSALEKCVARVLKGATVSPFSFPKNIKMKKRIERTDCVFISVKTDKPVPVIIDGNAVGMSPVEVRVKRGVPHVMEYTSTNGFTHTYPVNRNDCGKSVFSLPSWTNPAGSIPGP
jgi:hypothetical protein